MVRDSSCSCSWIAEGCDAQTGFRFYRDSCGQQADERREDPSCPQPDPANCDWVDDVCDGTSGFRFQVRDADSCPSPHQRRVADDACGPGGGGCEPDWNVACDTANGVNTGTFTWTDAKNCPDETAPTGQDPSCPTTTCIPRWSFACDTANGVNTGSITWTDANSCPGETAPGGPNPERRLADDACGPDGGGCDPDWNVACDQSGGVNTGSFTWTDANSCPGETAPSGPNPDCSTPCTPSWSASCDKNAAGVNTGTWTWSDASSCAGETAPTDAQDCPVEPITCIPTWTDGACEMAGGSMTGSRWQTPSGCMVLPANRLVSDSSCVPSTPTPMCQCYNCIQVGCDNCLENPDEAILFEWVSVGSAPAGSCLSQAELCPGGGGFPSGTQCGGGSGFAPSGADPSTIGRFSQLGRIGARPVGPGYSSLSPVSRATAPGRVSLQDSVSGASRAFMNDASRGGARRLPRLARPMCLCPWIFRFPAVSLTGRGIVPSVPGSRRASMRRSRWIAVRSRAVFARCAMASLSPG